MSLDVELTDVDLDEVWVTRRSKNGNEHIFHVRHDCSHVGTVLWKKPVAVLFDDRKLCEYCGSELDV